MKKLNELVKQGSLDLACEHCEKGLREDPLNGDLRAAYIELLCIRGDLSQADAQLDMMVRQHPDFLLGAVNLRQLIRADQARRDFYQGGMTATLFQGADAMFEHTLKLNLALKEADFTAATQLAGELEQQRDKAPLELNGQIVTDVRDLDDVLGGYVEVFGTDGKFYLAKFAEIASLSLHKPTSLIELVWRKAEIAIIDGPSGEAFLPLTYVGSSEESALLGRDTDWLAQGEMLATGLGQKMWLVGDNAMPLSELTSLERQAAASLQSVS
ncbi:virulence protein SciE type [Shewanella sp. AS16]|uniref:type VI secretion system accessory protein TagJ n=1 Tax=Shewanella sp. AS16 TaxID=2907625 RepID=UPI001F465852|nr:type VI secretion system accessory protein TagJ [Shewanella sp. AS16]MCE9687201.1 virulence protein SciE type [Shewanella sp. AS16]